MSQAKMYFAQTFLKAPYMVLIQGSSVWTDKVERIILIYQSVLFECCAYISIHMFWQQKNIKQDGLEHAVISVLISRYYRCKKIVYVTDQIPDVPNRGLRISGILCPFPTVIFPDQRNELYGLPCVQQSDPGKKYVFSKHKTPSC